MEFIFNFKFFFPKFFCQFDTITFIVLLPLFSNRFIDQLIEWLINFVQISQWRKKNYLNNHHLIFEREREKKTKSIIEINKTLKVKLIKIMTDKLSVCEHEKKKTIRVIGPTKQKTTFKLSVCGQRNNNKKTKLFGQLVSLLSPYHSDHISFTFFRFEFNEDWLIDIKQKTQILISNQTRTHARKHAWLSNFIFVMAT